MRLDRFRWVYCQLESLRHCLPPSVRGILEGLPETLDETYERVLRDINKANREHARRLLHSLTVAVRPLSVKELAEVLAVDFDAARQGGIPKSNPNWRWADQHQGVLSTCSSMIAIVNDGGSEVVQFSHFSVKEFLTSDRLGRSSGDVSWYHIHLETAHTILAQACLGVLLRSDDQVNGANTGDIPLSEYAARHWVDHAQFENVSPRIQVAMEYFFDMDKPHYAAWLRVYNMDKRWSYFTPRSRMSSAKPLYYAALCGFHDLTKHIIVKHPEHVDTRGGRLITPLAAALYGRHFQIAELPSQHGADLYVRGDWQRTLLHAASGDGFVDIVRCLLDLGVDVDIQQAGHRTALHMAAHLGKIEVTRLLLEHNANANAQTVHGEVPLHLVASPYEQRDQISIMQLLLDHGADVDARDNEGWTPLHRWSSGGTRTNYLTEMTVDAARLLLEHGASIDAEDHEGKTPRQIALEAGHDDVAAFLSRSGAK